MVQAFKRPEAIPIGDAAARLGCSVRTLQRIAREGGISFVRRGRYAYVLREDLTRLEVDGRTDWLVARLSGPQADDMQVAQWMRQWVELQRLAADRDATEQIEALRAVAARVTERDGTRSMSEYRTGELAATLDAIEGSSGPSADQDPSAAPGVWMLGLRILSRWPGKATVLSAYRQALSSIVGWQPPSDAPPGRKGRLRRSSPERSP